MAEPIFFDTRYAIALLNAADRHHRAAARWARTPAATRPPVITSEAILLEIGNYLARPEQ